MKARIYSVVGTLVLVLGVAFLGGSLLAYLQHVVTQIAVLAVVGAICTVVGIIMLVIGRKSKKNKEGK